MSEFASLIQLKAVVRQLHRIVQRQVLDSPNCETIDYRVSILLSAPDIVMIVLYQDGNTDWFRLQLIRGQKGDIRLSIPTATLKRSLAEMVADLHRRCRKS